MADQITATVFTYIDVRGLTTQALDALGQRALPPRLADQLAAFAVPIANGVRGFTRDQVGKVVQRDAFADAWVQANRVAHDALVRALTGEGGGAVTVENDTVSVNLAPFVETVKQRLVEAGFSVAARIPAVNASFVLFQSDDIPRARAAFSLLNTLGVWLPVLALVLLATGVYVARDHRRALVGAALGVALGMVVLALGLAVFRSVYLDAVPATVLPHDAAAVAVAAVALVFWDRQAIAYAQIADLPPQAGLFAAFAGLLGYALLGSSRQLIVSPTSSTAAITAALVAPVAGDVARFGALAAALAILVGWSWPCWACSTWGSCPASSRPGSRPGSCSGSG